MEKQLTPIAEAIEKVKKLQMFQLSEDGETIKYFEPKDVFELLESLLPKEKEVIMNSHKKGYNRCSGNWNTPLSEEYFNDNFKQK